MGFRPWLILLLLAMAMVAESSSFMFDDATFDMTTLHSHGVKACNGQVGDCMINSDEEMMMDSESSRRLLADQSYISYDALKANNIPCDRRGQSYYNCNQQANVNPYNRGCNFITKCARYT